MVCTFYLAKQNSCQNCYCYYELDSSKTCPIKGDYMAEIGAVDPALKIRLMNEERREIEKERAKNVIWGNK